MVPTMILLGLAFGRWWRTALVAGAVVWPVLLVADGVYGFELGLVGAAAISLENTAIGVAAHQAALALVRHRAPQHA